MLRTVSIALALLLLGCADDENLLKDGPSVGAMCGPAPRATFTEFPQGDPATVVLAYANLRGSRTRLFFAPTGQLSMNGCQLEGQGTNVASAWNVTIERQELGTFAVPTDAALWTADDQAASGSVTIDGYDASAFRVCGSLDATAESGGRLRGSFVAEVYCFD
jgi:hypothetical protein